jgi:iturin family lipopeptide synthetase A
MYCEKNMTKQIHQEFHGNEIAVIGMSGRFPGARNIEEFWENLKNGVESLLFLTEEELESEDPRLKEHPDFVNSKGGVVEDRECFDAGFFGYTPAEAQVMDPQIRLFHECSVNALEHAGYDAGVFTGLIGLYAGATSGFKWEAMTFLTGKREQVGTFAATHLADKDYLCTRVSHKLNLKGPSVAVQTACSTSLVAIHMAIQAILNGECDMALAGGVNAASPAKGYIYQEGMINSPDGHCRAFDAEAKGTVGGSGVGVVVLKLLESAIEDEDTIHAVIKGSAINNDGARRGGFTAPSREGQSEAIAVAQQVAEVPAESISYIETHGTATPLGDPIEVEALKHAFDTDKKGFCALGSVKTNIGHLGAAAGTAGLIKTILALKHQLLPPSLHYRSPNPNIDFENSPFYVNNTLKPWKNETYPRRAGVSSFGIGGTNAHVILEEWIENREMWSENGSGGYQLLIMSAKTETALERLTDSYVNYFKEEQGERLEDAAYTMQVGRSSHEFRRMTVCSTFVEAAANLERLKGAGTFSYVKPDSDPGAVFMFSGLGAQYENMGLELYLNEPVFRREMDRSFEVLKSINGYDIKEILYPELQGNAATSRDQQGRMPTIHQPEISQQSIFIIEYALANLLMHLGIRPRAMIGYSFGEYTAAAVSGVFSLEDALRIIAARAKLLQQAEPGIMLSVPLPLEQLEPFLKMDIKNRPRISLSIDNGESCIVSGTPEDIDVFESIMKQNRMMCMRLPAERAVHSHLMEPQMKALEDVLKNITLKSPRIPYISNVTGTWVTAQDVMNPSYWADHLRKTVRFADGIRQLVKIPGNVFMEIGPGREISALVMRYLPEESNRKVVNLLRPAEKNVSDTFYYLNKIGQLWQQGIKIDWLAFIGDEKRRRIPLPLYPFEKDEYTLDFDNIPLPIPTGKKAKPEFEEWFSLPDWTRTPLRITRVSGDAGEETVRNWLVFEDSSGFIAPLTERLRKEHHTVVTVRQGTEYREIDGHTFVVNPAGENQYKRILDTLHSSGKQPEHILHAWGITGEKTGPGDFETAQQTGLYSIIGVAKAIAANKHRQIQVDVLTDHLQDVAGETELHPEKATILSAVKVIPQEHPGIQCRSIDVESNRRAESGHRHRRMLEQLWREIHANTPDREIAYRGNHRWVQSYETLKLEAADKNLLPLKEKGVYLITGGLGKIGQVLAGFLAKEYNAGLLLTGRKGNLPEERRAELEAAGADVVVMAADSGDIDQMRRVFQVAEERWGTINGIIHAAGITGGITYSTVKDTIKEYCRQQFHPKVRGLEILVQLVNEMNHHLDFCWITSSLSVVLGGLRFLPYAAANIYMDAYVTQKSRQDETPGGFPWICVDWDGMEPEKTIEGFKRTLALIPDGVNRVVASNGGNLQERIDKWVKQETIRQDVSEEKESRDNLKARPQLMNPYIEPGDDTENAIAGVWRQLFGYREIGKQDDFFELGGDSLKAVTAISRIHRAINVEIPLTEFFKRPTVEQLALYVRQADKSNYSDIQPVEEKEYYVLSSAQKRQFLLQQMDKDGTGYNEIQAVYLQGKIDKGRLEESFHRLIRRHESLRTSIRLVNEEPVQQIHENVEFAVEYEELGNRGKMGDGVNEIVAEFIRPFDLSRPPFIRAKLLSEREERHVLVVDRHHIITDAVSQGIFTAELSAFYTGTGDSLSPLKIQYRDYAEWQNSDVQQEALNKQEQYWLDIYDGNDHRDIPLLNLPYDKARPAVQRFEGATDAFRLSPEDTRALKELAKQEEVTVFMLLLSIFYLQLRGLSGQEDIIVGSPVAGRGHVDLQNVMGMFVNTLAIRNTPAAEKPYKQFLKEIKESSLAAFQNQDYQFEDLVEKLTEKGRLRRDMSRNPLFDVVYVHQNVEMETGSSTRKQNSKNKTGSETGGLALSPYGLENKNAKFDLRLETIERGDQLGLNFQYGIHLFNPETIRRCISYFKKIVTEIITDPHRSIGEIELQPDEEKRQIIEAFNRTEAEFPGEKILHQLFEEQVERTPDGIALVSTPGVGTRFIASAPTVSITYRQLNKQAEGVARYLRQKGFHPQENPIVAVHMHRSIEYIISIIGILKAGGAFLPIAMEYPQERVDYMLWDCNASIIIEKSETNPNGQNTNKRNRKSEPEVLNFEAFDFEIESGFENRASNTSSTSLCYVIYTSGSTGRPKGTLVEHRALANLCTWHRRYYRISGEDRATQYASTGFDASVWEIFPNITAGVQLHIIADNLRLDIRRMVEYFSKHRITIGFLPTQYAQQFLEELETVPSLRTILTGGDKLNRYVETRLQLVNNYGPTENTVVTTAYNVESHHENIPIGKPIANTKCYILNPRTHKIQLMGVPGEIVISGDSLARGYLNNPELTAEKFIQPQRSQRSQRTYKTGDLGRWLPDGNIEFLGRIDEQVKIRGYRIELGEIQNRLQAFEGVREAVVVDIRDSQNETFLCAYVVAEPSGEWDEKKVRQLLARSLPDYMIPAYFVTIEEIPLTSRGKVNRRALPMPETVSRTDKTLSEPVDELEKQLLEIWRQVLGVNTPIGTDDNFFEIGGHSMKATIMAAKIHKEMQVDVPLADIFQGPTIKELAETIRESAPQTFIPIVPAETREYYPLTPAQKRLFILQQTDKQSTAYNLPQAMPMTGAIDVYRLEEAFRALIRRHESLRTSFHMVDGQPIQRVHSDAEFKMENPAAHSESNKTHDMSQIFQEFIKPFDLSRTPLFRAAFVSEPGGKQYLLLDAHHIITDRISQDILIRDFSLCYRNPGTRVENKSVGESPSKIQYRDYAVWCEAEAVKRNIKRQEAYWLKTYGGKLPLLELPADNRREPVNRMQGDRKLFQIVEQESAGLKALALGEGATLYMTVLALFTVFLSKLSGQEDIIVGSPVAGRRHSDLQQLIGMFVGTLTLRNFPVAGKSFRHYLKEVKQRTLEAFDNQDYPLEDLLEKITVPKEPGRNPLFDVFYQFSTFDTGDAEGPATTSKATPENNRTMESSSNFEVKTSKFDLYLWGEFRAGCFRFSLEYSTQLFKEETINLFIKNFKEIVTQVTGNNDITLGEIKLTGEIYEKKIEMPDTEFAF